MLSLSVRGCDHPATKPQVDHKRLAGSACIPSPWAIYLDALCQDTGGKIMDIPQSSQSRFCLGWRRMRRSYFDMLFLVLLLTLLIIKDIY